MGPDRTQDELTTGPWAAVLPAAHAPAAARLRLHADVRAAIVGGALWLRGEVLDESLDRSLRAVAPAARYTVDGTELIPIGRLLPTAQLPVDVRWVPLTDLLAVVPPLAAMPTPPSAGVRVELHVSERGRPATLLRATMSDWIAYADTAAAVRLRRLRFAATTDEVLISGDPLPPIPGCRLWTDDGIAVPCGREWSPPVDAATLRRVLGLSPGDLAVFREDGEWEMVPASGFVVARRSAVRLTAPAVSP